MNKKIIILLKVVIGLSILSFLMYKININEMISIISGIDWYILPLFFSGSSFVVFFGAMNIMLILKGVKENIKFRNSLKTSLISKAISSFLPGRLGELSLIYLLKEYNISYGKGLLTFIIDKLVTLLVLSFLSSLALFVFFEQSTALKLSLILVILIITGYFCLVSSKLRNFIKTFILRKHSELFVGFSKELSYILRKKKRILILNSLITISMLISTSLVIYLLLLYFGANVFIPYILIIHAIGILSAQIPISIAGLGVRESIVVYLYHQIGVEPAIVGTIYLLFAIESYLFCGGTLLYYTKKIDLGTGASICS